MTDPQDTQLPVRLDRAAKHLVPAVPPPPSTGLPAQVRPTILRKGWLTCLESELTGAPHLPRLDQPLTAEHIAALVRARDQAAERQAPGPLDAIAAAVAHYRTAFPMQSGGEGASRAAGRQFLATLEIFPAWAVEDALTALSRGTSPGLDPPPNFAFAASPAQISIVARHLIEPWRGVQIRCQRLLDAHLRSED